MYSKNKELEVGGISFGATSGVITTLGIIIGLSTAETSRIAIIISVLVLAFCDSLSDALGIQLSEESRADEKGKSIFIASIFTFIGKLIFSSIFILPLILLPLNQALYGSIILGFCVLTVFSVFIAKRRKISSAKELFENLSLAAVVLVVSYFLGNLADKFK